MATHRTLSCKLRVAEIDRVQSIAQAQGETKASLVQRLVRDYLQNGGKIDGRVPTEPPTKGRAPSGVNKGQPSGKTRSADRLPPRKSPSSDTSLSSALPDEGLPTEYLPRDHHQVPTTQPKSKPAEYNGPPSNVDVDDRSSVPSPISSPHGNHSDAKGKSETSPKSSAGILLLLGLFLFLLARSTSGNAVDHTSSLPVQSPSAVGCDLPSHNGDKSTVYSEMVGRFAHSDL